MISITVVGHLGKDAVMNNVNGKNVINFNIAHTEKYKDNAGQIKTKTVWVDCSWWSDRAGIVPYLKKGSKVAIIGSPDVRSYTTQDGRHGASMVCRVSSLELVGSSNKAPEAGAPGTAVSTQNATAGPQYNSDMPTANDLTEPLDDLPF